MSGCYTCGGFGGHHDPIAHDWGPEPTAEEAECSGCGHSQHGAQCGHRWPAWGLNCCTCPEAGEVRG